LRVREKILLLGVYGSGFRVWIYGKCVLGSSFRVYSVSLEFSGLGSGVWDFWFWVEGFGFRCITVWCFGFSVLDLRMVYRLGWGASGKGFGF